MLGWRANRGTAALFVLLGGVLLVIAGYAPVMRLLPTTVVVSQRFSFDLPAGISWSASQSRRFFQCQQRQWLSLAGVDLMSQLQVEAVKSGPTVRPAIVVKLRGHHAAAVLAAFNRLVHALRCRLESGGGKWSYYYPAPYVPYGKSAT